MSSMNRESHEEFATEVSDHHHRGPGARLRAARERAKMTKGEVAKQLYLRTSVIEAIENDDFSSVQRRPVFTRGYLRAYANLVKLSPDDIIKAFNELHIPEENNVDLSWHQKRGRLSLKEMSVRWLVYTIVIILIATVAVWWYGQRYAASQYANQLSMPNEQVLEQAAAESDSVDLSRLYRFDANTSPHPKDQE